MSERFESFVARSGIVLGWAVLLLGILFLGSEHEDHAESVETASGQVVRILAWGDIFDPLYIRKFEEMTGIAVHMSSYTSNEELMVKLKAAKGRGYDLILPSDYAVALLIQEKLLKKLDQRRIPLLARINPLLKHQSYDPENEYSIPYEWEIFGIAYDKEFFKHRPLEHSWKMLFSDPRGAYKIIVSGDSREMVRAAAHYLYGPIDILTEVQQNEVEALLRKQRAWVEAYTQTNLDYYLISGFGQLAFASSAYVGRRKNFVGKIGFFVPREGSLVTIENMALPIYGEHEDAVYAFMDFILSPESAAHHFERYTYFPATQDSAEIRAVTTVAPEIRDLMYMKPEEFKKLIFIKRLMPEERTNDLWVRVKA